jgi:hypothetical protein
MNSLLLRKIYELCSFTGSANGRFYHRLRGTGNRDNRSIVVTIHGPIEQGDTIDPHRIHDSAHRVAIRTF